VASHAQWLACLRQKIEEGPNPLLTDAHYTASWVFHCLGTVNAIGTPVDIGRLIQSATARCCATRDVGVSATNPGFTAPPIASDPRRRCSVGSLGTQARGGNQRRPRTHPAPHPWTRRPVVVRLHMGAAPCGMHVRGLPHAPHRWLSSPRVAPRAGRRNRGAELPHGSNVPHIPGVAGKGPLQRTRGHSPHGMGCACCMGARAPSAWAAAPRAVSRAAARGGMPSTSSRRSLHQPPASAPMETR
jgi:hypothetical protein